jgi:ubiquinone/menaquinone biosynthesis C-methylase UbiE
MSIDQSYDQWADSYDLSTNKTRDLDRLVTRRILAKLDFNDVLELGCGTGKNTEWLITKAKSIKALDFSRNMLDQAKAKVQSKNVQFIQADLQSSWPLPNQAFDLITCNLVLEHIEDLRIVFQQAFDKLRNGRHFFIAELHPNRQYKGSQAKFETPDRKTHLLEVFTHHISDYLKTATKQGLTLVSLDEWFDGADRNGIPRLVSFLFQKH